MALPPSLSSCTMCVSLSTNGTDWTDMSDYLSVVTPDAMTRATGEAYVFGEDTAVTTVGKRAPASVTLRGVYASSSATTTALGFLWAMWTTACGGPVAVAWAPEGCTTDATDTAFATATATGHASELVSLTFPSGDASDATPLMFEAVVRTPEIYWYFAA
jgi:hypothetical protein